MREKIFRISIPGIAMLVSLSLLANPVSASTASWSAVSIPSTIDAALEPVGIIIVTDLLLMAIFLIIKYSTARPFRLAKGFGDRLVNLRAGLVNYFKDFNPLRTFRETKARIVRTGDDEVSHSVSFAAESFLWMTSAEKGGNKRLLSADEEQKLGKILASRIQALAREQLLYQKFPKEAAAFLYLWAHYGSRYETNQYLTDSFQSRPENAIILLKCYLTTPGRPEPDSAHRAEFSRTQYDSVAKVLDPNKVYEALTRLYGPELDSPESQDSGHSPDKAIALQFVRIHQLVNSEMKKPAALPGQMMRKR